eukprot:CAMPEP_0171458626 /NCGR_PEP_ID=MMETSP0945-20130129/4227_1 /TAXON_ID=109269 /ORGANISM="Vaucheria litorea, Strain CCMP2940" /LENGTH=563 /DNA_ID=CAMNT_0011984467 /DNA_START=293 /DNA_END=1984 /DNA_ORIENTATION=+
MGFEGYESARIKMDELFFIWLSQKSTAKMIKTMLESVKSGGPIDPIEHPSNALFSTMTSKYCSMPPKSQSAPNIDAGPVALEREKSRHKVTENEPKSAKASPTTNRKAKQIQHKFQNTLPNFFVLNEGGRGRGFPLQSGKFEFRRKDIMEKFTHPNGNVVDDFVVVTKNLCGFPSFFNAVLFKRILSKYGSGSSKSLMSEGRITLQQFCQFWRDEIEPFDTIERFFRIVKKPGKNFIGKDDFTPYIAELLKYHPGLDFLQSHPDFHPKYSATVTARIFYTVNKASNGKITLRELRKSNLVSMFNKVDEEEDINKVTQFFSYEHFYVLFCRFYELDSDRDNRLNRENLRKYGDYALSNEIVDRIFEVGLRPFEPEPGAPSNWRDWMSYQDYVYFMLSEEDRGNETSLKYWFTCVDLDGDGRIGHVEMRHFYDKQMQRMESLGHEVVAYADMVCLIWDMLHIGNRPYITLEDLIKPDTMKISGVFFDCLFNLSKFIGFEQRDPFSERQKRADPFDADWDRFAYHDYNRLAAEDERETGDNEGVDIDCADEWVMDDDRQITVEAPF